MITRFITEVNSKFNPFSTAARATRLFLTQLPSDARQSGVKINTVLLPRTSTAVNSLIVKFKDGKELDLDSQKLSIKDLIEECDRHSRILQKQADLND